MIKKVLENLISAILIAYLLVVSFFMTLGLGATARGHNTEMTTHALRIGFVYCILVAPVAYVLLSRRSSRFRALTFAGGIVCLVGLCTTEQLWSRIVMLLLSLVVCSCVVATSLCSRICEKEAA